MYVVVLVKIDFAPMLPARKLHVLQRMPVGYLTKLIVTYKQVGLFA